jgi:hypothetical protein
LFRIAFLITNAVIFGVLAYFTVEFVLLFEELDSITGLMKACIARIAREYFVPIVNLSTEAYLAIGLKEALKLLYLGACFLLELFLEVELFDHSHLERVFKHPFSLVRVSSLEAEEHFGHPKLLLYFAYFFLTAGNNFLKFGHPLNHLIPVLSIAGVGVMQF